MHKMTNRNPVKQWFITFPQWNKYDNINEFEKISPKSKWGYVVMESHENGGVHYHLMLNLIGTGMTKSKMLAYWTKMFPNDYKRIDIEPTKSFNDAHNYLQKEKLEVHEWGQGKKLPSWLQAIKDEWDINKLDRELCENRCIKRIKQREKELYEYEHTCVYCWCCDRVLPCDQHDGNSIFSEL